jgi:thioredoxin reductase (NADPH)
MTDGNPSESPVDLAIIGAGPVGLYAAYYAGLRRMSVKLIDSLSNLGGQLVTLYPEKYIYDVAGFPKILAKELAANLIAQGTQYGPMIALGEQVQKLEHFSDKKSYRIHTNISQHDARCVLIAAGVGAFRPKKLASAEMSRFEGHGLFYSVQDPQIFKGKRVLIVGGGDSAVDWANALSDLASQVTVIHRRDVFRAHEEAVRQMRQGRSQVFVFNELISIHGDRHIESAMIVDNRDRHERLLSVDAVLANIGFETSLGPISKWELKLEGATIQVDHSMQTNRPGIFAAGDVAAYPGKLKLISVGFGEAAIAVNHAKHFLDPVANIFPGHSSDMKRR